MFIRSSKIVLVFCSYSASHSSYLFDHAVVTTNHQHYISAVPHTVRESVAIDQGKGIRGKRTTFSHPQVTVLGSVCVCVYFCFCLCCERTTCSHSQVTVLGSVCVCLFTSSFACGLYSKPVCVSLYSCVCLCALVVCVLYSKRVCVSLLLRLLVCCTASVNTRLESYPTASCFLLELKVHKRRKCCAAASNMLVTPHLPLRTCTNTCPSPP